MRDTKNLEAYSKAKEKENKQMSLFRNLQKRGRDRCEWNTRLYN
jgi:hypothetical protein